MIALFIIVVLTGCLFPFFIKNDDSLKNRLLNYGFMLADMLLLLVMIKVKLIYLPLYGEIETITIGESIIILAVFIAKLNRIINNTSIKHEKQQEKLFKSHHHKAAS